jgi:hypothetical protein
MIINNNNIIYIYIMINRFSQLAPDLPKVMRSPSVKPDDAWRKFVGSPPGEASMFPRWETWEIHWETVGFSLYIYTLWLFNIAMENHHF